MQFRPGDIGPDSVTSPAHLKVVSVCDALRDRKRPSTSWAIHKAVKRAGSPMSHMTTARVLLLLYRLGLAKFEIKNDRRLWRFTDDQTSNCKPRV